MSTPTPTYTPAPVHTEHDIQNQLIVQIDSFAAHQRRVTHMFVGIVILVLALAGVGAYLGLQAYEREAGRAEAIEQKYEAAQKAFAEQLAVHDAERTANAEQTVALVAQITARAKQAPAPVVVTALQPSATATEVRNGLEAATALRHPDMGSVAIQGETIALRPAQAQQLVSDELLLTRTEADLWDTGHILALSKQDNSLLTQDLNQCKDNFAAADKTIAVYKKAAVITKWKKFLTGAQKVGILIVGISLGHTF